MKPTVLIKLTLTAMNLIVLAATTKVDSSYLNILFGLVPMSIGMGNTFVPLTLIATTNIDTKNANLASNLFNTFQQIDDALGLTILSSLATSHTSSYLSGLDHEPSP